MIDRPRFKLPALTSEGRVAVILGAGLFAIYAAGACRTIFVGDSGELVAAVHVLGIPHPSSYPLYVLLGKLWTILLPVGSIAFRMSLFSAAFAAAACVVLYLVAREAGLRIVPASFAALLLAFNPTFWAEANVQRVYSLNTFFVALATLLAFRWHRTRRSRDMALTFFVCGLGGTNHTVMLIYAVAFALFVVLTIRLRQGYGETSPKLEERRRAPSVVLKPKTLASSAVALIAGLLPYAYLPLRSRADPPIDWQNPESLDNFLAVVLRRDFWERRWLEGPADFITIAADYIGGLATDFAWVGLALGVVGLVSAWRRRFGGPQKQDRPTHDSGRAWPLALVVLVMAGNVLAVALHGSRSDIFIWHRYYLPSYVMVALLAGLGCQLVLERLPRYLTLLPLTVPVFLLVSGYQAHDRSRFRIAEDFSRLVLRSVSPGGHLIASDDNILFVLMYLHFVEEARPDVDLLLEGVGGALPPSMTFNPDHDPLFLTHYPNWKVQGLEIVPVGLVFQAWRQGRRPPEPVVDKWHLDGELDPRVPKDYLTRNLIGQFHYMLGVTLQRTDWLDARQQFEAAMAAAPDNDVLFFNLGLVFREVGLLDEAIAALRRADSINPRKVFGYTGRSPAERVAELTSERARIERVEGELAADASLAQLTPDTREYDVRMAMLLDARGERVAAQGRRLRALERVK